MTSDYPLTTLAAGLTEAEARAHLESEGYNELPRPDRRTAFRVVVDVWLEPMLALLLGAGFIYFLLGDLKEGMNLLIFALVSIAIRSFREPAPTAFIKKPPIDLHQHLRQE